MRAGPSGLAVPQSPAQGASGARQSPFRLCQVSAAVARTCGHRQDLPLRPWCPQWRDSRPGCPASVPGRTPCRWGRMFALPWPPQRHTRRRSRAQRGALRVQAGGSWVLAAHPHVQMRSANLWELAVVAAWPSENDEQRNHWAKLSQRAAQQHPCAPIKCCSWSPHAPKRAALPE